MPIDPSPGSPVTAGADPRDLVHHKFLHTGSEDLEVFSMSLENYHNP